MKEELLKQLKPLMEELAKMKIPAVFIAELDDELLTAKNVRSANVAELFIGMMGGNEELQESFLSKLETINAEMEKEDAEPEPTK